MNKTDTLSIRLRMRKNYTRLLRLLAASCAAVLLAALFVRADVTPANTTITFLRADPNEIVTNGPFFKNSTLLLTNCVLYAGTSTNAGVQDLTSCTITVKVGSASTAYVTTNGTIQVAGSGTWWTRFTVPTNTDNSAVIQVTVYDNAGNSYTYNWKVLPLRSAL